MIVEPRDYHVFTGKLRKLVTLYETEGDRDPRARAERAVLMS